MNEQPWYQNGLRFRCTQCGDCCTGAPGYVWVNKEEIAQLADLLGIDVDRFERLYARQVGIRKSLKEYRNGDCIFFDGQQRFCQVYSARPRQCRTWPFWESNVRTPEAWQATCEFCPGSGRGRLHTIDEIESQRGVIRV